jgi:hypothetical protein
LVNTHKGGGAVEKSLHESTKGTKGGFLMGVKAANDAVEEQLRAYGKESCLFFFISALSELTVRCRIVTRTTGADVTDRSRCGDASGESEQKHVAMPEPLAVRSSS